MFVFKFLTKRNVSIGSGVIFGTVYSSTLRRHDVIDISYKYNNTFFMDEFEDHPVKTIIAIGSFSAISGMSSCILYMMLNIHVTPLIPISLGILACEHIYTEVNDYNARKKIKDIFNGMDKLEQLKVENDLRSANRSNFYKLLYTKSNNEIKNDVREYRFNKSKENLKMMERELIELYSDNFYDKTNEGMDKLEIERIKCIYNDYFVKLEDYLIRKDRNNIDKLKKWKDDTPTF